MASSSRPSMTPFHDQHRESSPTKRRRLTGSTPSISRTASTASGSGSSSIATPTSGLGPMDDRDYEAARQASVFRVRAVWNTLEQRYARGLDEDDIVDLGTGKVVQDRGVLRSREKVCELGSLLEGTDDEGREDDDNDTEGAETDELALVEGPEEAEYDDGDQEPGDEQPFDQVPVHPSAASSNGLFDGPDEDGSEDELGGWDDDAGAGETAGQLSSLHYQFSAVRPKLEELSRARSPLPQEDLEAFLAAEAQIKARSNHAEPDTDPEDDEIILLSSSHNSVRDDSDGTSGLEEDEDQDEESEDELNEWATPNPEEEEDLGYEAEIPTAEQSEDDVLLHRSPSPVSEADEVAPLKVQNKVPPRREPERLQLFTPPYSNRSTRPLNIHEADKSATSADKSPVSPSVVSSQSPVKRARADQSVHGLSKDTPTTIRKLSESLASTTLRTPSKLIPEIVLPRLAYVKKRKRRSSTSDTEMSPQAHKHSEKQLPSPTDERTVPPLSRRVGKSIEASRHDDHDHSDAEADQPNPSHKSKPLSPPSVTSDEQDDDVVAEEGTYRDASDGDPFERTSDAEEDYAPAVEGSPSYQPRYRDSRNHHNYGIQPADYFADTTWQANPGVVHQANPPPRHSSSLPSFHPMPQYPQHSPSIPNPSPNPIPGSTHEALLTQVLYSLNYLAYQNHGPGGQLPPQPFMGAHPSLPSYHPPPPTSFPMMGNNMSYPMHPQHQQQYQGPHPGNWDPHQVHPHHARPSMVPQRSKSILRVTRLNESGSPSAVSGQRTWPQSSQSDPNYKTRDVVRFNFDQERPNHRNERYGRDDPGPSNRTTPKMAKARQTYSSSKGKEREVEEDTPLLDRSSARRKSYSHHDEVDPPPRHGPAAAKSSGSAQRSRAQPTDRQTSVQNTRRPPSPQEVEVIPDSEGSICSEPRFRKPLPVITDSPSARSRPTATSRRHTQDVAYPAKRRPHQTDTPDYSSSDNSVVAKARAAVSMSRAQTANLDITRKVAPSASFVSRTKERK